MAARMTLHCPLVRLQLAKVEAQHTGFQGAVVVVLRSMMAQERSLREDLGDLASELEASLPVQADPQGHRSASCPAESSAQQWRSCRKKCTTPQHPRRRPALLRSISVVLLAGPGGAC